VCQGGVKSKNMSDKNSSMSIGGLFTTLLLVAFIVLKLCNVIKWSWIWVLSPIWIPIGLVIIGLIVYVIFWWRKSVDTKKRLAVGMNEWAWKNRNKKKPELKEPEINMKSKFQQRMEEMQTAQKLKDGRHDL
jgi:hypothetical protein